MKNFNKFIACFAVLALVFTSCSKDEETAKLDDPNAKVALSFGPILNELMSDASSKQALDIPECSDANPAYVSIVLSQNGDAVVGSTASPFQIDLVDGELFTEEVPELKLMPGNYSLDHFEVYDAWHNRLWIAPKVGGDLAAFSEDPLPLDISLGADVKKYVDVPVLCFDDRMVNEYGYLFFDFNGTEAIEFCIFGNYCPPADGRHYPAKFSVDVWTYSNGATGDQLYSDVTNSVELNNDGDFAGSIACFALPDTDGVDEYYFEITLLSSDAYGNVEENIIRHGVITDDEVRNFFDGDNNLDYWHFREGCENDDSPPIFQDPEDEAEHYKACLKPMNGSEAIGFAYLRLEGNSLETTVMATGLEVNSHLQHIHENGDCDNPGPPILALNNEDGSWPAAEGVFGDMVYHRTFSLGSDGIPELSAIDPLMDRTVKVHGMTVDGSYNAGIVVACGEINMVAFD